MTRRNDHGALAPAAAPDPASPLASAEEDASLDELFGALDREIDALDAPSAPAAAPPAPPRAPALTPAPVAAAPRAPTLTPVPVGAPARAPALTPVPAAAPVHAPTLTPVPVVAAARVPTLTPAPAAPAVEAEPAWPGVWPGTDELDDMLARGMVGLYDGPPLGPVAQRVIEALSPLERAVLGGEGVDVDGEVIRRATRMRLRVGAALATAPCRGTQVDSAALSALLAEIDAVLSAVATLAAEAPQTVQLSLDGIREALVKEAIDLSEAAQAIAPVDAPAPAAAPRPRAVAAPRTRVLSVSEGEHREPRGNRALAVMFALSLAGAAAFWGFRLYARSGTGEPTTVPGAPSNSYALNPSASGVTMIRSADGKPFSADEVRAFVEQETAKGNAVRQVSPAVLVVVPPRGGPTGGAK